MLNQLLKEGASRCQELAEEAAENLHAVRGLVERVGALRETVAAEAGDAHRRLRARVRELEEAEGRLESAGDGAKASLSRAVDRAGQDVTQVSARLHALRERLEQLDGSRGRLQESVDARAESSAGDFEELGVQVARTKALLGRRLQGVSEDTAVLREAVASARDQLAEDRARLREAVAQVARVARERGLEFVQAMGVSLGASRAGLVGLRDRLLSRHNQAKAGVRSTLAAAAPERCATLVEQVRAAVASVAELCEGEKEALRAGSQPVVNGADEAGRLVETMTPVLLQAGELG
jgi:chromosome segregation ATPase